MRRRLIVLASMAMLVVAVAVWLKSLDTADADQLLNFTPPTLQQRMAAIGDVTVLSPTLQRAFDPITDFAPIPKPGPRDWLAKYHEGGQTFAQFVEAEPNRPDKERHTIYLLPLGDFDKQLEPQWEQLREFTETYFTLETKLLPALKIKDEQVTSRINSYTQKTQWQTGELLALLEKQLPDDAYCLLGITLSDLYPNAAWSFVFGQATLRNRVGIYSFARFDPAFFDDPRPSDVETLILRRSCRTLAHEACHMFGMHHCIFFTCVVNGSNHLAESDSRPLHACPVCLRKLHESLHFDPLERDRRLLSLYRRLKLTEEADWLDLRLKRIESPMKGIR